MDSSRNSDPPSGSQRTTGTVFYIFMAALATVVLGGLKLLIEHTSPGRQNEMWVYGKLQRALPGFDQKNPITLIDIGQLPDENLLPRIQEVIQALTELSDRPLAIAVDVDFSPPPNGDIEDEDFLEFCLEKKNQVPIFLAVGRNKAAPAAAWLGQEKYKELAVAVALDPDDTREIPIWVQTNNRPERLNTMNYALALKHQSKPKEPPVWIGWAVDHRDEEVSEAERDENLPANATVLTYGYRLANYSKLDTMKMAAKKTTSAASIKDAASDFKGMLVIIGDVSRGRDVFPVPGLQQDQAGSLLMGCATYALIKEPVFEFKPTVRLILDFVIAGVIIGSVAVIRYRYPNRPWIGWQTLFIGCAIVLVLVLAWLLAAVAGVMWSDFILVAAALFLHPKVEQLLHKIFKGKSSTAAQPAPGATVVAKAVIGVTVVAFLCASSAKAQHPSELCKDRNVAAVVVRLRRDPGDKKKKKTCYLRADRKGEGQKLSEADVRKLLNAGQDLFCDNGCALELWLCGSRDNFTVEKHLPKSYTVKSVWRAPGRIIDPSPGIPAREISENSFTPRNPVAKTGRTYEARNSRAGGYIGAIMGGMGDRAGNVSIPRATPSTTASKSDGNENRAAAGNVAARNEAEATQKQFGALLEAGNAARDAGKFPEAEEAYRSATKLIADDSRPFYGLGNLFSDQQKWDAAGEAYQQAISLDPYQADAYLALATVLLKSREVLNKERMDQIESLLWRAARIEPENEAPYELMEIALYRRAASLSEFETTYRQILRLNPRSVGTNLRLSTLLWQSARRPEASRLLSVAESAASGAAETLKVAQSLEDQKQYDRAERAVLKVLKERPSDPQAKLVFGLILIDRKQYSAAASQLRDVVTATPNEFVPNYLLGIAYLGAGDLNEAEASLNAAATKMTETETERPALASWLAALGDAHAKGGRFADAVRFYELTLKYDSNDGETKIKLLELRMRPK